MNMCANLDNVFSKFLFTGLSSLTPEFFLMQTGNVFLFFFYTDWKYFGIILQVEPYFIQDFKLKNLL